MENSVKRISNNSGPLFTLDTKCVHIDINSFEHQVFQTTLMFSIDSELGSSLSLYDQLTGNQIVFPYEAISALVAEAKRV